GLRPPPPSSSFPYTTLFRSHPEAHGPAMLGGAGAHVGDLLGHRGRRLAPGQVGVDVLGGQVMGGCRGTTKIQRRVGLLHRWEEVDRKSTRLNSSHVKISYAV